MFEHVLEHLAGLPPGAELGKVLADIDPATLDGHDQVTLMRAWARQVAHAQAGLAAAMFAVATDPTVATDEETGEETSGEMAELMEQFALCEITAALRLTRRAAQYQLNVAVGLHRWPAVAAALSAGVIDLARAEVIFDAIDDLPPELAAAIVDTALAITVNLTSAQLRARLRKLIIKQDPITARRRYRGRVEARMLMHWRGREGAAHLSGADLPVERAAAAYARVCDLADLLKRGGDPRSVDQLRADVFLDLLEGVQPTTAQPATTRPVRVDVVVSLTTLMGLTQDPGHIPGWGPVIDDIARRVAAAGFGPTPGPNPAPTWRYRLTDDQGRLLHTGPINPGGRITRPKRSVAGEYAFVRARDQHCRFPGCQMPARRCDVDHTIPRHRGGPHDRENLAVLCRRCHRAKDEGGYRLRQLGHGALEWTTRRGHVYRTDPDPAV